MENIASPLLFPSSKLFGARYKYLFVKHFTGIWNFMVMGRQKELLFSATTLSQLNLCFETQMKQK